MSNSLLNSLLEAALLEAISKPEMQLITLIAAACKASKPTARSVTDSSGYTVFKTALKDSKEHLAAATMKGMGFTEKPIKSSGGSSSGDFSSDEYGSVWVHTNGVTVSIYSSFKSSPPSFNIKLSGSEVKIASLLSESQDTSSISDLELKAIEKVKAMFGIKVSKRPVNKRSSPSLYD